MDVNFTTARYTSSWREEALARICGLRALIDAWRASEEMADETKQLLLDKADTELTHASQAAQRRWKIRGALNGAAVQRVHGHLDTAEVLVLRVAPPEYVRGQTADLIAYVRQHLVPSDPRCQSAEQVLAAEGIGALGVGAGIALGSATASDTGPRQMSPVNRDRPRFCDCGPYRPAGSVMGRQKPHLSFSLKQAMPASDGAGKVTAVGVFDHGSALRRASDSAGQIGELWGLGDIQIGDAIGESRTGTSRSGISKRHHFAPPAAWTTATTGHDATRARPLSTSHWDWLSRMS